MQTRYIYMGFGLARCHWYQCMQSDRLSAAAVAAHSVDSIFRRDGALIYSLIVDLAHPCCAVDLLVLLYAHAAQIGTFLVLSYEYSPSKSSTRQGADLTA